jgi:pimeloyl-ACP methyl ester carboxylesterase
MEQVASLGYQAIAIDLPPFGYSLPPISGDYSKQAQARRILGVLDALAVTNAVFVGHSFGAGPLMEAVLLAPQRAWAIVLVDAALGLDESTQGATPCSRCQAALAERTAQRVSDESDITVSLQASSRRRNGDGA